MKVGFIVECGPEGAETQVIPHLAQLITPSIEPDIIPLDKKPILKRKCGKWAKALLDCGCRQVVIVWDLLPDWEEYAGKGCLHVDRQEIADSLRQAGIDPHDNRVGLVCIHMMLEAWLIADERAISDFLSTDAHHVSVPRKKKTESIKNPKSALIKMFKTSTSRISRYEDTIHAIKIVKKMPDLNRLKRLSSFKRFKEKLET